MKPDDSQRQPGTLYADLVATGAAVDNHESDLYIEDTPAVRAVLARYPGHSAYPFVNAQNGRAYLDLPFMYLPWWEARTGNVTSPKE